MLQQNDISSLVSIIVDRLQPEKVIIFGSYAKGVATPKSDLDIFVIQRTSLPAYARRQQLQPLIINHAVKVDVHIYSPEETAAYAGEPFSFVHSVLKTGYVAYSR
ncbi:nucleotidyltransferase domain-containing protein [Chitinophaga sp. Mgbs1]|uniref:Nucleotidyltransferase domain-containing protein n=1 Tax=Chitinophaga solisilvae TaxID=1233460 RepID=A0A3S1B353_9BACT|nr:nucleotidyltransferase domain-containing protein [Chitinophaga solisilvae]